MLDRLRPDTGAKTLAGRLYRGLMERARAPVFYLEFGVADTIDGRFDLVALHAWLVLDRLAESASPDLAQALANAIFVGFDEALREMGVSDMGAGRRLKAIADAFYGRLRAYGAAGDLAEFAAAISRNIYRSDRDARALVLATYALAARSHLAQSTLAEGQLSFGPLPGM